jgi:ADP-dependent NAD(P)H-hydrate dehydratase / NAD(P)H-hydrate epimerase
MKIFSSHQIRQIDDYTIKNEPVAPVDLMERAAGRLFRWITERFERSDNFIVFAGPGNNGGDGLALARMLSISRYSVQVIYVDFSQKRSEEWEINRQRLEAESSVTMIYLRSAEQFPVISSDEIIVDAIFGAGLTRPAEGLPGAVIQKINNAGAIVISIDTPSGLFIEDNSENSYDKVVRADYTLSFQFSRLSFMFAENAQFAGEVIVLPIGLNKNAIATTQSPYSLTEEKEVAVLLKKRKKFDHKGNFGHGLLISGSSGKIGAAVLGAKAALRSGIGLITCHVPSCGIVALQTSLPEAMVKGDKCAEYISEIGNTDLYDAVGIGPGIGTHIESQKEIHRLLTDCKKPLVIDADALNIISLNKEWLSFLPAGSILTPHPKEFERLAGKSENGYDRMQLQIRFSHDYNCIVVLKGAYTSVSTPDGKVSFNSTGNPGMATAGSGDVLTGILLSLLSQGYDPADAALLGVYLHGLAGDIAASLSCYESLIASDIIKCIGKAFNKIRDTNMVLIKNLEP